jgi:hypothetical protein
MKWTDKHGIERCDCEAMVNEMLSGAKGGIEGPASPHDTATCPLADCPDCESERGAKP